MSHRTKGENMQQKTKKTQNLKHLPKPFCRYKTMSYDRGSLCCPRFGRTPLAWSLNLTLQKLYQQYIHYTYKKIRKKNPNITNFVLCILNPTERGFPNFQYWEMSGKSPFSTSYRFFVKFFFFPPRKFSPCAPDTILQFPIQWCCRSFNSIAWQLKTIGTN